jgi:hypothetical protein
MADDLPPCSPPLPGPPASPAGSPAGLPALRLDRPESVLSLPPWLIDRLAALSPWDEGTTRDGRPVPTIPASLTLTGPMRTAIERRRQDLLLAGEPGPLEAIERQVGELVARYSTARTDEVAAGLRIEWYMDALSDQPAWAVKEAIRRWRRGACGPHRYDFAPSEALLRRIVEEIAAVARGQRIGLRRLLAAEPVEPLSEEARAANQARVAKAMAAFLAGRRGAQAPQREAARCA